MTEQEQIEAAKAALAEMEQGPSTDIPHDVDIWYFDRRDTIIAAAPALVRRVQELEDWQAKALPLLKTKAFDLQDDIEFVERVWKDEPKSNEWLYAQKWRKELEPINALIEQAEGSR
jgi:hypothetical protein